MEQEAIYSVKKNNSPDTTEKESERSWKTYLKTKKAPPLNYQANSIAKKVATASLLALAFSALFKVSYANTALALLLIATLLDSNRVWRTIRTWRFTWITLAYLLYLLAHTLWINFDTNSVDWPIWDEAFRYVKIGFLPSLLIGYWIYRLPHLKKHIIMLLPLGFLLRIIYQWDVEYSAKLLNGTSRATFGDSAVSFGLWALISSLFFIYLATNILLHRSGTRKIVIAAFYLLGAILCCYGLLLSQTRSAWLIGIITIPIYLLTCTYLLDKNSTHSHYTSKALAILTISTLSIWIFFGDTISDRWQEVSDTMPIFINGDWAQAPPKSIGLRLHMIQEAWTAWLTRPILGWGVGSSVHLIQEASYEPLVQYEFLNFHNDPLTILLELGIPGFFFFLFIIIYSLLQAYISAKTKGLNTPDKALMILTTTSLVSLVVASISNSVLDSYRGPFVFALLVGIALSTSISRHEKTKAT